MSKRRVPVTEAQETNGRDRPNEPDRRPSSPATVKGRPVPAADTVIVIGAATEALIPAHRRCPLCWGGRRGYGVAYSSGPKVTYYRCRRHVDAAGEKQGGGCGHTWLVRWRRFVDGIEDRRSD